MAVATKFAEPLGPDDNLSVSIGESAFFIDDYASESVRELLSPVVGDWNALNDSAPFSIDVHELVPEIIVIPHRCQTIRIEFKFLDIFLCDEQVPLTVLQNTVGITFNLTSALLKGAAMTDPFRLGCGILGGNSLWLGVHCLCRAPSLEEQQAREGKDCEGGTHAISTTYYALYNDFREQELSYARC
jgi:hypothetical protein